MNEEKETLEEKETKFDNNEFVAGDISDDIRDLIRILRKLKKRIKDLEDRVDVLEG
jgi:hypothetical protein